MGNGECIHSCMDVYFISKYIVNENLLIQEETNLFDNFEENSSLTMLKMSDWSEIRKIPQAILSKIQ